MRKIYSTFICLIIGATGFCQSTWYVNDNSIAGDVFTAAIGNDINSGTAAAPFATLLKAITTSVAGDIIYVDAGSYAPPDIILNKAITILGANYLISPNDATDALLPNAGRNTESIITNCMITLGASNITIKGFTFDPQAKQQIQQLNTTLDFDNINIEKNSFLINSNQFVISMSGKSQFPLVTFNFYIVDNRFIKNVSSSGTSLSVREVDNIQVLNNTFTVSTVAAIRTQSDMNFGSFRIDNLIVSHNTAYRQNFLIQGTLSKNTMIDHNKAIECNRFVFATNNLVDPAIIDIVDNIVTNDKSTGGPPISYVRNNGSDLSSPNIARIERNTISVNGTGSTSTAQALIAPTLDNISLNTQVYIRDNKLKFYGDFSAHTSSTNVNSGIRFLNNSRQAVAERNEIEFNVTNYGADNKFGIYIAHSGLTPGTQFDFLNNKISGFTNSVAIMGGGVFGNLPNGVAVNIHNNSFTNDVMSINNGTGGQQVFATCNWYNTTVPEVLITKVTPESGEYLPWLVNGTDNEPFTTGFQPVPGSCTGRVTKWYVNDAVTTGDIFTTKAGDDINGYGLYTSPFATITRALIAAQAGDTIYVDAGSYALASNLTLNKSITILGSNHLVSPNNATDKTQYNSARNSESIIKDSTILISADYINIKGLRFSPVKTAVSLFANYSHIKVDKNLFDVAGIGASLNLQGVATSPIVAYDFSVTDCRFQRKDTLIGSSVNLGLVKTVLIDNNTFIETPTTGNPYRGIALRTVPGQSVEGVSFSNNYVKKVGTGVLPSIVQNFIINNNIFDSCVTGYNHNPKGVISNNIYIKTNTFTNARIGRSILVRGGSGGGINNLNIIDNTINQEVDGINGIVGMIQLDFYAANNFGAVSVLSNKLNLSGNYNNAVPKTNCGIILIGNHSNTTLSGNELNFSAINFQYDGQGFLPNMPTGIFINTDNVTGSGPIPASAIINITNNKISGFKNSVGNYDPAATGLSSFVGYGNLTGGATVNINNNSFTNDSMSIDNGAISQEVYASCNWYGFAAVQNIINKVSVQTGSYAPYLTNGTDNEPLTTGFQPVPGSCNGLPLSATLDAFTNVTCNGANNGTINITVTSGVAPYSFAWTKDNNTAIVSTNEDPVNLLPGVYHVTLTDASGTNILVDSNGIYTINVTIMEPPVLTAVANGTNNLCFGNTSGTATVNATGGIAPYTYSWSNGATTQSISNLIAAIYTATVTDSNGCSKLSSYEVTQPSMLTANATGTNVSCFSGNNGSATATAGGGTLPYTYSWSNGTITQNINTLVAATYSVTITDSNSCTSTASYQVTQPTVLSSSASGTNVSCFGGSNGSAAVSATGGTTSYTYLWSNNATTSSITNLVAGTYSVTVTDANVCTTTASYTVTQPFVLSSTANITDVSCFGGSNGSVQTNVIGGTAPYTYLWSTSSTTSSISNLSAGTYSVTITDANGCSFYLVVYVNEPDLLTATATGTNNICFGGTIGIADVNPVGGTLPYSYLWSNGATTDNITGLAAGIYSVTITDANGCTVTSSYTVTQPIQLTAIATGVSTACSNSASVSASGGTGTYTYLWNNGATTATINSIASGTYIVTVTDINGCTTTASITLTAKEAFNPSASVTDVSCYGGLNGIITVTNANGAAPFQYSINGLTYQSSNIFSGLATGTYTITVVDANGCSGFITKTISQPPLLTVVSTSVLSTCFGASTGAISVTAAGGTGAIIYSWSGPNGFTSSQRNISNLATGNYTLTVTDNNNCTASINAVVPTFPTINVSDVVSNIKCKGEISGSIILTVTGGTGSGFRYSWNNGATTKDIFNLGVANYNVTITDIGSGCVIIKNYTIVQPANVAGITATKTNATGCNNLGTITATGSGGSAPYQYSKNGVTYQSSGLFPGLYAGNYTIWIKDANGCIKSTAAISITDNGSDEYESNNSKNGAKAINIGTSIYARIALSTDVADWFKITTPSGSGNYTLSMVHPSVNYTFNMYPSTNNAPALTPLSSSSTAKTYSLAGNTTYYIQITGALSYNCYQLMVAPLSTARMSYTNSTETNNAITKSNITKPVLAEVNSLNAMVFPNPHQGNFKIKIESPRDGTAVIEIINTLGQVIEKRNVSVKKGKENIESFTNMKQAVLYYRVRIGSEIRNGKVIGHQPAPAK